MMISQALAEAPIVRFTVDERAYRGDGVPRDFSGKPLDWFLQMVQDAERGDTWGEE
ncbi:hypothetical protein [Bifidobacterium pseudolongum]|uniref:hypothetical protein n=2 Tax=Bifidobacterium pseudolongum TaxID=1694 RepID=UPI0013EB1334|nr:hypothetical protein [Bifidobacterium pseudolongum]